VNNNRMNVRSLNHSRHNAMGTAKLNHLKHLCNNNNNKMILRTDGVKKNDSNPSNNTPSTTLQPIYHVPKNGKYVDGVFKYLEDVHDKLLVKVLVNKVDDDNNNVCKAKGNTTRENDKNVDGCSNKSNDNQLIEQRCSSALNTVPSSVDDTITRRGNRNFVSNSSSKTIILVIQRMKIWSFVTYKKRLLLPNTPTRKR
jgi:hypothetical protein